MANKYEKWLTPHGLLLISGWCRDGLTDKEVAKQMHVADSTFREWKKRFPELQEAVQMSKEYADRKVENALFKRALGYDYTETKVTESTKDGTKVETTTRHMAPDVTAQIFWLKNRKRAEWRDKVEREQNITFESDGFLEALRIDVKETFRNAADIVEE